MVIIICPVISVVRVRLNPMFRHQSLPSLMLSPDINTTITN